jgi:hypothetical protein
MTQREDAPAGDETPIEPPVLLSARIDPLHRLGASIVLGLGLSVPTLRDAVSGDASLAQAAWMFGVALAVAWLMVWLVWAVWHLYRSQHDAELWKQYEAAEAARRERLADAVRAAAEAAELEALEAEARLSMDAAESERQVEADRLQRELDELVVDTAVTGPEADRRSRPPASLHDALSTAIEPLPPPTLVRDASDASR